MHRGLNSVRRETDKKCLIGQILYRYQIAVGQRAHGAALQQKAGRNSEYFGCKCVKKTATNVQNSSRYAAQDDSWS